MKYIIAEITDSFWAKNFGLVITFSNPPESLNTTNKPYIGQPITIVSPTNVYITTTVGGIERFARCMEFPNDSFGILVRGLIEEWKDVKIMGWNCIFHL